MHHKFFNLMCLLMVMFLTNPLFAAPAGSVEDLVADIKARARDQSEDLSSARTLVQQKKAESLSALARRLPRLDTQLSGVRSKDYTLLNSGQVPNRGEPNQVELLGWNLKVTTPIYRRSVGLGIHSARQDRESAEIQLRIKELELDWRVRSLLGSYFLQAYRSAVVEKSIGVAQGGLEQSTSRFELGQAAKIDVLKAQTYVESLRAQRAKLEREKEKQRDSILEFTGLTDAKLAETGLDNFLGSEAQLLKAIENFSEYEKALKAIGIDFHKTNLEDLNQIIQRAPLYQFYLSEEKVGLTRARILSAQEFPELVSSISYGKQDPALANLFSGGRNSYSAGLVLNIPLSLSTFSSFKEQVNAQRLTEIKRQVEVKRFMNDLRDQIRQISMLSQSIASLATNVHHNEEIVTLSEQNHRLGRLTLTDLLSSQNALDDAKVETASAKIELAILVRRLAANLGVQIP